MVDLVESYQNNNNQTLMHLSRTLERDLDITDMAHLLLLKRYKKRKGKFIESKLKEMVVVSPAQVLYVADLDGNVGYDDNHNAVYFCPQHRNKKVVVDHDADPPKCAHCGFECLQAAIELNAAYQYNMTSVNPKTTLYGINEVISSHGKYWPGILYGYSVIYTLWSKVMALAYMDEYVRKYFDKMRPPKGLLVIGSRNYQSLQKVWNHMKEEQRKDPYTLNPLMVETERGGRNMVQYVDLTGSLQDLQFIDIRDEFRRTIGAMVGVIGLFEGDIPSGWSNEGTQIMVTNRAVEWGQDILYRDFYKPLMKKLGIYDWEIKLKAGEENDELRDEQLEAQKISNAQGMHSMGFKVERDAEGRFVFSQSPQEETAPEHGPEKNPTGNTESQTNHQGEPAAQGRPSDQGGVGGGSPASGPGTSQSKKSRRQYRITRLDKNSKQVDVIDP